jgi:hypothetical protein
MKIYVRHKLYFYESCSGAGGCGLKLVSSFANLADYHGKTLFVSETVEYNNIHPQLCTMSCSIPPISYMMKYSSPSPQRPK